MGEKFMNRPWLGMKNGPLVSARLLVEGIEPLGTWSWP